MAIGVTLRKLNFKGRQGSGTILCLHWLAWTSYSEDSTQQPLTYGKFSWAIRNESIVLVMLYCV